MAVIVVTGTGTGVGKTIVTAAVCALGLQRGVNVAVVKPAQTGVGPSEAGDLAEVRRLCLTDDDDPSVARRLTLVEGVRYPDPLSPAAAARTSGRAPLDLQKMAGAVAELHERHRLVLVEGAGGLLVRFDEEGATIADLAAACAADVLVVTSAGLGALNATALTLEALAHRGLPLAGLVIGDWPAVPDLACWSNVADFEMLAARPLAGALATGASSLAPAAFTAMASAGLSPVLGGGFDPAAFRADAAAKVSRAKPGFS